jgi:hypothetical protein
LIEITGGFTPVPYAFNNRLEAFEAFDLIVIKAASIPL